VSGDILKAYLHGVYSYFRRLGVDSTAAEDLTQDTFLVTWQNRHKLSSDGKLQGYLYGVAYRRYLQHMDRTRARPTISITDQIEAGPAADPGSDQSQAARSLREAVLSLPPNYRHPLVLLYWQDLSYREAAHALSLRMGTFAWRVQEALKLLRQRLDESREEVAEDATSTAG
jgi:RNA polymerase sigma-70 factor (ECF subfamily)